MEESQLWYMIRTTPTWLWPFLLGGVVFLLASIIVMAGTFLPIVPYVTG